MQQLTPFAWIDDDNCLHLDAAKVLDDLGWPHTDENLAIAAFELAEFINKLFPTVPVLIRTTENEKGFSDVERN